MRHRCQRLQRRVGLLWTRGSTRALRSGGSGSVDSEAAPACATAPVLPLAVHIVRGCLAATAAFSSGSTVVILTIMAAALTAGTVLMVNDLLSVAMLLQGVAFVPVLAARLPVAGEIHGRGRTARVGSARWCWLGRRAARPCVGICSAWWFRSPLGPQAEL